jgi:hypothetical protein
MQWKTMSEQEMRGSFGNLQDVTLRALSTLCVDLASHTFHHILLLSILYRRLVFMNHLWTRRWST